MRPTSSSLAMRVLRRPPLTMKTKLGYSSLTLWKGMGGGDHVLKMKMAWAIHAHEQSTRCCFRCNSPDHLINDCPEKREFGPPPAKGASTKQVGSGLRKGISAWASSVKMKKIPYLNPDAYRRFIGPKNWGKALIDDELTTCLLDNGSQLNFITPAYAKCRGMDVMSLDVLAQEIGGELPPILGIGGIMVKPDGFVMMNIKVPGVKGYKREIKIAIIMEDPGMTDCPVILGTPTIF